MTGAPRRILCTGGCGYIGTHTVVQLLNAGYFVTILDNLSNSSTETLQRIKKITGAVEGQLKFVEADLLDVSSLRAVFQDELYSGVIHYAGLKSVGESVENPLMYYENNVSGTCNLLKVMSESKCKVIVFSSSATVYKPKESPICESDPLGASNPYGQTKIMVEQILKDLYSSDNSWRISILRYFNPVGAHPSGLIGESPDHPNNLLPVIQHVSVGRRKCLSVFGDDWGTADGTGVRDYLHVDDLASGHLAALKKLESCESGICMVHNLGTGCGHSVLELKTEFEKASGVTIPYEVTSRRPGDLATVVADVSKAKQELQWTATRTIQEACASAWKWQSTNPEGYA